MNQSTDYFSNYTDEDLMQIFGHQTTSKKNETNFYNQVNNNTFKDDKYLDEMKKAFGKIVESSMDLNYETIIDCYKEIYSRYNKNESEENKQNLFAGVGYRTYIDLKLYKNYKHKFKDIKINDKMKTDVEKLVEKLQSILEKMSAKQINKIDLDYDDLYKEIKDLATKALQIPDFEDVFDKIKYNMNGEQMERFSDNVNHSFTKASLFILLLAKQYNPKIIHLLTIINTFTNDKDDIIYEPKKDTNYTTSEIEEYIAKASSALLVKSQDIGCTHKYIKNEITTFNENVKKAQNCGNEKEKKSKILEAIFNLVGQFQLTHYFKDANKRLSKVLFSSLAFKHLGKEEISAIPNIWIKCLRLCVYKKIAESQNASQQDKQVYQDYLTKLIKRSEECNINKIKQEKFIYTKELTPIITHSKPKRKFFGSNYEEKTEITKDGFEIKISTKCYYVFCFRIKAKSSAVNKTQISDYYKKNYEGRFIKTKAETNNEDRTEGGVLNTTTTRNANQQQLLQNQQMQIKIDEFEGLNQVALEYKNGDKMPVKTLKYKQNNIGNINKVQLA